MSERQYALPHVTPALLKSSAHADLWTILSARFDIASQGTRLQHTLSYKCQRHIIVAKKLLTRCPVKFCGSCQQHEGLCLDELCPACCCVLFLPDMLQDISKTCSSIIIIIITIIVTIKQNDCCRSGGVTAINTLGETSAVKPAVAALSSHLQHLHLLSTPKASITFVRTVLAAEADLSSELTALWRVTAAAATVNQLPVWCDELLTEQLETSPMDHASHDLLKSLFGCGWFAAYDVIKTATHS